MLLTWSSAALSLSSFARGPSPFLLSFFFWFTSMGLARPALFHLVITWGARDLSSFIFFSRGPGSSCFPSSLPLLVGLGLSFFTSQEPNHISLRMHASLTWCYYSLFFFISSISQHLSTETPGKSSSKPPQLLHPPLFLVKAPPKLDTCTAEIPICKACCL